MSIIAEIFDVFREIKDNKIFKNINDSDVIRVSIGPNSIAKKANNAILQFPILVSDSISINDLTMVSKALERQYATYIRVAMGLDDSIEFDENKLDHIKKFHQNMNYKQNVFYIDKEKFLKENLNLLKPFTQDLRLKNLNEMTTKNNRNYYILGEDNDFEGDDVRKPLEPKIREKSQYTSQLLVNDVNKSNELIPTVLDITGFYENIDGDKFQINILLGIKTIAHLIPSEEMIYNISKGVEEKRFLFRFIQWTTGEISFFKDFVLCLDRIKKEATNQRTASKWWRSLKVRSISSKFRRMSFSKKELLPNCTILISMDEVEYILNNYNIDLLKDINSVQELIDTFFLLGFVIIDPASELVYFLFHGESNYQTFSFNALEKEGRGSSSGDIKALVSLMNRI